MYGGASDGGAAAAQKQQTAAINQGEQEINQQFSGFTPSFYQGVAQDYTNYATPQMMQQYQATKNNLAYALARNGLLNSGAAAQRNQSLGNELATQESNITNAAQGQANQMQSNVQTAKGNVTNQLISSQDPALAEQQAAQATAGLRAPAAYQPIGNLFSDWSNTYLANMNAQAMNPGTPNIWQMLTMNGYGSPGSAGGSSTMVS